MGLRLNTNLDATSILFNLSKVDANLSRAMTRLSTGLRINSAADDPSGFMRATNLESQIDSLTQAISITQDSANMVKTATDAMGQISTLLSTIRASVQSAAANVSTNPSVAQAEQITIQNAIASINSIAASASFNNRNLLDGTAGTTATVTDSFRVAGLSFGGYFAGGSLSSGTVTVSVVNAATFAQAVGTATYASVNATLATVNGGTTGTGGNVTINGRTITVSGSDTVQTLINQINAVSSATGVSAAATTANGSTSIVLTQQTYGANYRITASESAALIYGTAGTSVAGTNATVTVQAQTLISGQVSTALVTFVGGRSSTDSGLRVSDTYGNSILLTEAGNVVAANLAVGSVSSNSVSFQVGPNTSQTVSAMFPNVSASNLGNTVVSGLSLATIDVTSATGANNALQVINEAITQVSRHQATLGSFQKNVLDSAVNVMRTTKENLSASLSSLRDADIASETINATRLQTLQQAGLQMLGTSLQNNRALILRLIS
jgi:flagellin